MRLLLTTLDLKRSNKGMWDLSHMLLLYISLVAHPSPSVYHLRGIHHPLVVCHPPGVYHPLGVYHLRRLELAN